MERDVGLKINPDFESEAVIVKATTVSENPPVGKTVANVKVLHLINGEHFSGAERVQDLLAMALPEFGYDVGFACVKPGKFSSVRRSRTELFDTPMSTKFDFRSIANIANLFRENGYAMLHAHTPRTLMVGVWAARRLGCPLIYHVHSPVGRDSEKGFSNRVNTWMESWSLRGVDRMICVSQSLAAYMQELGHDAEKIRVVSNGVAPVVELPPRQPPTDPWVVGTMALFRPRKGTEILLEAIAILKGRGIALKLRAVGPFETDEYKQEIMDLVTTLEIGDQVQWLGFQTDVDRQLQEMDLFVLPSLYGEGLPMVVLEAMANAVPVVASRVEGIPEAVRDGIDGLIFEPCNPHDLADQLATLIGDHARWKQMSESCRLHQRNELSDVSMARGVARVYDELGL